jgi:hypothetical protein
MLKSFSTLCMLLVRIIRVVNIGDDQSKGSPVHAEVLFHPVHVTSENHLRSKYRGEQSKGSPVPS